MVTIALGSKERFEEDINQLLGPQKGKILILKGPSVDQEIKKIASSLFLDEKLVLVLFDPPMEMLKNIKGEIEILKDQIRIVLYFTSAPPEPSFFPGSNIVTMETEKDKRIEERVRIFLRTYGKKMTKKAFETLRSYLEEEGFLDSELMKLINFVGEKEIIEPIDVTTVVSRNYSETVWDCFNSLINRDKKRLIEVLDVLISNGLDLQFLQSYLIRQTRLLIQAREIEVFERPKTYNQFLKEFKKWREYLFSKPDNVKNYLPFQRPFYAFKLLELSEKFSEETLFFLYDTLFSWEIESKKGTKNERIFLEQGLLRI